MDRHRREFSLCLRDPVVYLDPNEDLRASCLRGVKFVFDFCKSSSDNSPISTGPLAELCTDGFCNDSIWEEVELLNEPALKQLTQLINTVGGGVELLQNGGDVNRTEASVKTDLSDLSNLHSDIDSDDVNHGVSDGQHERMLDIGHDWEYVMKVGGGEGGKGKRGGLRRSIVDDQFFRLAEMEAFLKTMEAKEEEEEEEEEEGGGGKDYFVDIPSDSEIEQPHYEDFFDPPSGERERGGKNDDEKEKEDMEEEENEEGEEEEEEKEEEEEEEEEKEEEEEEEEEKEEEEEEEEEDEGMEEGEEEEEEGGEADYKEVKNDLSTYEKKQQKLQSSIATLEAANLAEKSWQMSGETSGRIRPVNSLLEEDLSFDHMGRPPPTITEDTTLSLEELIKQRIKDESWDDVERRVRPPEKPYDFSRSRPLQQEQSKLSLAEVYEQEYIKQTQALEEDKEDKRHTEIRELMTKLFVKLDALSNFHFTPKPPKPEVKITANVRSLTMEEVAPVATSDAALLAPEEIQSKTHRPDVGASEKTDLDKRRERRLRKKRKRLRLAEKRQREKLIAKLRPGLGNKYSKRTVTRKLKEGAVDQSLKSSSKFFAQLQREAKEQVEKEKRESGGRTGNSVRTMAGQQYKL